MDILAWIALIAVVIVFVLEAIYLRMRIRPRKYSVLAEVARSVVAVIALAGVVWASNVTLNTLWAAVAALLGLVLGFLLGRASTFSVRDGKTAVESSPWPDVFQMIGYLLALMATFFATGDALSGTLIVVVLGTGMIVGSAVGEVVRAGSVRPATA